jgi:hypothetical protein
MKCWSSTWLAGRTTFDLAQGAHRWVDVVFADDGGQGVKALRFGFPPRTPLRLGLLGFGNRGSYSFRVIATAENASAVKKRINWDWDGSLHGLKIKRWWWPTTSGQLDCGGFAEIGPAEANWLHLDGNRVAICRALESGARPANIFPATVRRLTRYSLMMATRSTPTRRQ